MKLSTYLMFEGNCREAFTHYEKVLGGKIQAMMDHKGTPAEEHVPAEWRDKILHACLEIEGQLLMGRFGMGQQRRANPASKTGRVNKKHLHLRAVAAHEPHGAPLWGRGFMPLGHPQGFHPGQIEPAHIFKKTFHLVGRQKIVGPLYAAPPQQGQDLVVCPCCQPNAQLVAYGSLRICVTAHDQSSRYFSVCPVAPATSPAVCSTGTGDTCLSGLS